jgi:hypothetical protein
LLQKCCHSDSAINSRRLERAEKSPGKNAGAAKIVMGNAQLLTFVGQEIAASVRCQSLGQGQRLRRSTALRIGTQELAYFEMNPFRMS